MSLCSQVILLRCKYAAMLRGRKPAKIASYTSLLRSTVRKDGAKWLPTLKTAGPAAAVLSTNEKAGLSFLGTQLLHDAIFVRI